MGLRTPLYDRHVALGARMVDFGGWDMPLQYSGMRDEHLAVRTRAGLFDVSHMGEVLFSGPRAHQAVQGLIANDLDRVRPGQALYSVMCNERGGIVDDVIVYHRGAHICMVVNAACRAKDVAFMEAHVDEDAGMRDISDELALLALQGPAAARVLQRLTALDLSSLAPFHVEGASVAGVDDARVQLVARTGYTGEDGFEVMVSAGRAGVIWDAVLDAGADDGVLPCGLGARDTLRLEAGLRLYGQDMDEDVDPFSAGLGWTVKLDKGDFVGAGALRSIRERGAPRRTVGLALDGRAIARHGQPVLHHGEAAGVVTSGTFSFTLGHGIATALVDAQSAAQPGDYGVDIRGSVTGARQVPLPFYRRRAD